MIPFIWPQFVAMHHLASRGQKRHTDDTANNVYSSVVCADLTRSFFCANIQSCLWSFSLYCLVNLCHTLTFLIYFNNISLYFLSATIAILVSFRSPCRHQCIISSLDFFYFFYLILRLRLANASRPKSLKSPHWVGEIWHIILRLSYPLRIIFFFSVQSSLRTLSLTHW